MKTPKSVKQICQENNIPINCVYRRLKKLEQKGLLEKSGVISNDGVKTFLYQS
ncbi:MAG: helix-turn-helix transcriptional regulator [Thaumarchaeota archaeon]|nr:helix-turn-helix transcriptional regulator [Nitrososphaerota archaeon]